MSKCTGLDCSTCLGVSDVVQPIRLDFQTVDDVAIVQMHIPEKGTLVPQHAHKYAHTSMLARGSVKVWKGGVYAGEEKAPKPLYIAAGVQHAFEALENDTVIYCIHNTARTGEIEIAFEHKLVGEG